MKYYKVQYKDECNALHIELHVPATVSIADNPCITIIEVKPCDCQECLIDAWLTMQKIRELVE